MMIARLFAPSFIFALTLFGCSGGTGGVTTPAPISAGPAPVSAKTWHGRYVGTVFIDGETYFADALLTIDGVLRLYISGPSPRDSSMPLTNPQDSAQFVGSYVAQGDQATANGVLIAERCSALQFVRFCNKPAVAEISFVESPTGQAEIQVTAAGRSETWQLELKSWVREYYLYPPSLKSVEGQYVETNAEFAIGGDTVITIDRTGQLFFQGAHSGCTGNGTLAPHLDGIFNVYDVALTIGGCNDRFSYLNGEFAGLATTSSSTPWDYDFVLRTWLSKRDAAPFQVAITLLGNRM